MQLVEFLKEEYVQQILFFYSWNSKKGNIHHGDTEEKERRILLLLKESIFKPTARKSLAKSLK